MCETLPRDGSANCTGADTAALNRATLARQMLLSRESITPREAIERLAGMQAQLARPPFVGLWSRLAGFRRQSLAELLARREVIRATFLRCTLHLVSARDYLALRGTVQPVLDRAMNSVLRDRLDAVDLPAVVRDAHKLFHAAPQSFEQLRGQLAEMHPAADERAMGYVVRTQLPLVQVPTEAPWSFPGTADFALAESWLGVELPAPKPALETLVQRYLAALGPASVADAQAWSGLQGLRAVLEALRPQLAVFQDEDGREPVRSARGAASAEETPAPVRFVPEYDNMIVARADARFVPSAQRSAVFLPGLRIAPTFLVDGIVAGTWSSERKRASAVLSVEPFSPLGKSVVPELTKEAEALLRFLEPDATTVDVRIETSASKRKSVGL